MRGNKHVMYVDHNVSTSIDDTVGHAGFHVQTMHQSLYKRENQIVAVIKPV